MENFSYGHRTYKSVDDMSLSLITSEKSTERKIEAFKAQLELKILPES